MKIKIVEVKFYKYLTLFGLVVFVLSNAYFGWNKTAQSGAERFWDIIWGVTLIPGIFWWAIYGAIYQALNNIFKEK